MGERPQDALPTRGIPLIDGVATNIDDKVVRSPALLKLENCVWSPRGVVSKRPGSVEKTKNFSALNPATGSWTTLALDSIRSLFTIRDELVAVDDDGVPVSFSQAQDRWWQSPSPASLVAPAITVKPALKEASNQLAVDVAVAGNWVLHVWQAQSDAAGLFYTVTDRLSGAVLIPPTSYGNINSQYPSATALGGVLFALYVDTTALELRATRITPGATPTIVDGMIANAIRTPFIYDTEPDPTGTTFVACAYTAASSIELLKFNSAGTVTGGPSTISAGGLTLEGCACTVEPNVSHIGVAWIQNAAGSRTLAAAVRQSDVTTSVLAATAVHSAYSTSTPGSNVTCVFEDVSIGGGIYRMRILYQDGTTYPGSQIRHASITTAAAIITGSLGYNATLATRAFRDQKTMYVWTLLNIYPSAQRKHVLVVIGGVGANASERFFAGKYVDRTRGPKRSAIAVANDGSANIPFSKVHAHAQALGGRLFVSNMMRTIRRILDGGSMAGGDGYDNLGHDVYVDFSLPGSALSTVEVNGVAYLSGGMLMQYDRGAVEAGFLGYPNAQYVTLTPGVGGSQTPNATVSYIVRYAWINPRGQKERSTYDFALTVTLGGAQNRVTLTLPTLPFSMRPDGSLVFLEVFRTQDNPTASSQFYKVTADDPQDATGSNRFVINDPTVATVTLIDDRSSAGLPQWEPFDLAPTELDPINVSHCRHLATDGNRLWVAGLDDDNVVWPSKLVSGFGNGVEFNEGTQLRVDDYGGRVTGLAIVNEQVIVFKERAIYVITGDGPDNTGSNGQFSTPALVHSDVGCVDPGALCITPQGILFLSHRGWCLLTQQLGVEYVGAPVAKYESPLDANEQPTRWVATLHPRERRVQLLSQSYDPFFAIGAPSLIYDYEMNAWGTLGAEFVGTAAVAYGRQYVYGRSDGTVRFERPINPNVYVAGDYKDGTAEYAMLIGTAWQHADELLQAYLRGGKFCIVGTYWSPARLEFTVYFDYESAGTTIPFDATATAPPTGPGFSAGGKLEWRDDLPSRHHFHAVRFDLREVTLTSPALDRSFTLAEIALEMEVAGGLARLPVYRSG